MYFDLALPFQVFPRLYYVSDDFLLSVLSDPSSLHTHLHTLFGGVAALVTTPTLGKGEPPVITAVESVEGERLQLTKQVTIKPIDCF